MPKSSRYFSERLVPSYFVTREAQGLNPFLDFSLRQLFRHTIDYCNDHETWRLNVAHVLFMQENKYREAIGFYESIVEKHMDNLLGLSAVALANLCVSYIMTSKNEEVG